MRVLYVNHTGQVSGAERSLLDLLGGSRAELDACLACPLAGPLASAARRLGIPVAPIVGTEGSLKLNLIHTPRALAAMSGAAIQVAWHARAWGADVLHANSIRAGLIAIGGGRASGRPVVVHLRDRLPRGRVADATLKVVDRGAAAVIANSRYTAEGFRLAGAHRDPIVIPNPVDLNRFDPESIDRDRARSALGLSSANLALGVIGQITPWKGQADAVEALALLADQQPEARLYLVGEAKFVSTATRYDNRAYLAEVERRIDQARLRDRIQLLGEREDIPAILRALDILLVPSWEEPFGRVVVEGMAMGLGVIATSVGGPSEVVTDGVDGLLLAPRNPDLWAAATARLASDRALLSRIGARAMQAARAFGLGEHVAAVRSVYGRLSGMD